MKPTLQASVLFTSLLLSSCVIAVGKGTHEEDEAYAMDTMVIATDVEEAQAEPQVAEASAKSKSKKPVDMESLHFDLRLAQMDMQTSEAAVARASESAQHAIALAERDLRLAQEELEHYVNVDMKISRTESELSLDRSRGRLDDTRAELQQLLDMYKDEEFAESTKELVITRGKRGVNHSERSLALAEERASDKRGFEQARKMRGFQHKIDEATRSLRLKAQALETANAEGEAKLMRARNKVRLAQKKVEKAAEEAN